MKKPSILVVAVFALGLLCFFIYGHPQRNNPTLEANRRRWATNEAWVKEKDTEWNKGGFIATGFPDVVGSEILGITNVVERGEAGDEPEFIKLNENLDAEQRQKLSELVRSFFVTFGNSNITFFDYLKFKTTGRTYRINLDGIIGEIISNGIKDHYYTIWFRTTPRNENAPHKFGIC
jgi:hypothetical protein